MKKLKLSFLAFGIAFTAFSQTEITPSSDIWYSTNATVIGNSGNLIESYSGFNSQNNKSLQLHGNSVNYGIPTFSFVKAFHQHKYGGSLSWLADNFPSNDRRFAQISGNLENGSGSISFDVRNSADNPGQFKTMVFDKNGYLGIGTTSPDFKLQVENGDIYLRGDTEGEGLLIQDATGSIGTWLITRETTSATEGYLKFGTPSNETQHFYFETSRGNVGIGTNTPDSKLSIYGTTADGWNSGVELNREGGGKGWIAVDNDGMKFRTPINEDGFYFRDNDNNTSLFIEDGGNVGIGTTDPLSKLAVNGKIRATEVKVLTDITVPDYVFESDYELRTLKETKEYIEENKHLPEIPSAAEIEENGIDLGDMNMKLLKKIEELTLYQIQLLERLEKQKKRFRS